MNHNKKRAPHHMSHSSVISSSLRYYSSTKFPSLFVCSSLHIYSLLYILSLYLLHSFFFSFFRVEFSVCEECWLINLSRWKNREITGETCVLCVFDVLITQKQQRGQTPFSSLWEKQMGCYFWYCWMNVCLVVFNSANFFFRRVNFERWVVFNL